MYTSRPFRPSSLLILGLAGCPAQEDPPETTTPAPDPVTITSVTVPVAAGWDPMWVSLDDDTIAAPVVETRDGTSVDLAPLAVGDVPYAWVGDPPLPPAVYTVLGTEDIPVTAPLAFEIGAYGFDEGFDPQSVVGTTWVLSGLPIAPVPTGLGAVLLSYLGESLVTIDAVDGDQVDFRVFTTIVGSEERCQVLRSTGTLTETGDFSWAVAAIDADTDPVPVHVEDVSLHWGWLPDASRAAGVEGAAIVDTRPIDPYLDPKRPGAVCDLLGDFGADCRACASDGADACADVRFYAGELTPTDEVIPDDVLLCGVDLEEGGQALSCDVDLSGLTCAGVILPLGVMGWVGRRRRRPGAAG